MMNINMYSEGKHSVSTALCDTIYGVFDNLYGYRAFNASGLEVIASNNKDRDLIEDIKNVYVSDNDLQYTFSKMKLAIKPYEDTGIRLKDDTADVEMRSIYALDEQIQAELSYYRDIYKAHGLKGLFEELLG